MSQISAFFTFILSEIPAFLMSEPIIYFVALYILLVVIAIVQRIIHISD